MWTIERIDEADYGCEERMPGEPTKLLITLENDYGTKVQFEVAEHWIEMQELSEGDEWPENIDDENPEDVKAMNQLEWMDNYYQAIQKLDE